MGSIAGDKVRGTKYDLIAIVRGTKSCCHDSLDKLVTKYMVQSIWYKVHGTKYVVQSTWYKVHGLKYMVQSTW